MPTCPIRQILALPIFLFSSAVFAEDLAAIKPFLQTHCYDCHGGGAAEGGLELDKLSADLTSASHLEKWIKIHDRVRSGEMPPPDADPQPTAADREKFATELAKPLTHAHAAQKGTVLRRLNRNEYENTLNDMFGTTLDLSATLPPDGRSHEFDNVGEKLSISLVQMQRYLDAADAVMDAAIVKDLGPPVSETRRVSYADGRDAKGFVGSAWLKLKDNAIVFFRSGGYPSGMLREANIQTTGYYKIRVTGYAYQTAEPITFAIGSTSYARGSARPTYGYFSMPPLAATDGKPTTVEVEAHIDQRYMIEVTPYGLFDKDNTIRKDGIDKYKGPGLAVLHIELEGPLTKAYPTQGHKLLFDGLERNEVMPGNPRDRERSWYKPRFEIATADATTDAKKVLERVATQAFRRPVESAELQPYVALFAAEQADGATVEEALKTAVAAVLCSPHFLYLQENPGKLNDHALASRLSYFLTRTLPDEQLLAAANVGKLTEPAELLRQTERLLNNPRSERFIDDFADAWLNLRDIEFTNPDRDLFPEFDQYLQYSSLAESKAFLRELIEKDHSVVNVVKSDFAMLNDRLAAHYGITGVIGPEIRRVNLPADSVRGGFLSQASVLKVSANGTNTSPVVRGVWVTERILGQVPDPPPPGINGVEPDVRGAKTLRELLDKHRDSDSCRACHQKIDPPGFALESFNPIGGWRDRFRSLGDGDRVETEVLGRRVRYKLGPPVDATGSLPSGESFDGFVQFRDQLATDEDALARAFAKKLLTFATGREMGFSDRREIDRIVSESAKQNHGVRGLIKLVVTSEIFLAK
jgi:hypothetical protein